MEDYTYYDREPDRWDGDGDDDDYGWDVYGSPRRYGLRIVLSVDWGGDYEFNMLMVWYHAESGRYYWGTDSGCSCPSPFEDATSLSDLSDGTYREMLDAVSRVFDGRSRKDPYNNRVRHNVADAKAKLAAFHREVS